MTFPSRSRLPLFSTTRTSAGALAGKLLDTLGEPGPNWKARPHLNLKEIDNYASFLQRSAIEKSTFKCYQTGACDYISFCLNHHLSLEPAPKTLSRYSAYSSLTIASAAKYLSRAQHFLIDLYPDFDHNRNHPLILSTIRGSKKVWVDPVVHKLPLRFFFCLIFPPSLSTASLPYLTMTSFLPLLCPVLFMVVITWVNSS